MKEWRCLRFLARSAGPRHPHFFPW